MKIIFLSLSTKPTYMIHYYFKFNVNNSGYDDWINKTNNKENVELSIYFDTPDFKWKASEFPKAINYFAGLKQTRSAKQIELFFKLREIDNDTFFWIFHHDKILVYEAIDLNVKDGKEFMVDQNQSNPKSISAKLINEFDKISLPAFFANLNANQKYNRGTIAKLNDQEQKFATALIASRPIEITKDNFYKFLSPIEFETLIFQIFNQNGNYCSAFRGGTLKDYDLRVNVKNPIEPIGKGIHWIQLKKKEEINKENFEGYIITTAKSNILNKILGLDWIISEINGHPSTLDWMSNAVFGGPFEKFFSFNWKN